MFNNKVNITPPIDNGAAHSIDKIDNIERSVLQAIGRRNKPLTLLSLRTYYRLIEKAMLELGFG